MELMQVEMFVAVVELGSVRAAAAHVFRTQPAVSIAIRKLEQEFEVLLFDRSKRYAFRLTPIGETLYHSAKRMLVLRDEAVSELADASRHRMGRFHLGANESISLYLLPQLAKAFLKVCPDISFKVKCAKSEELLADLTEHKLDVALLSFRPNDSGLVSSIVADDELVLIANPKHTLATKRNVTLKDLVGQRLLMMHVSRNSPWHKFVVDGLLRSNGRFDLQVENAPIETVKKMVALDLGVGFVPLMCVRDEVARGELTLVEIAGFRQKRSVWLVRRCETLPSVASAFVRVASAFGEHLRKVGPQDHPRVLRFVAPSSMKFRNLLESKNVG